MEGWPLRPPAREVGPAAHPPAAEATAAPLGGACSAPTGPDSCYKRAMQDETPRNLPERTGRHVCTQCLAVVRAEELFPNDHICDRCAVVDEYPLASTPEEPQAAVGEARDEKR